MGHGGRVTKQTFYTPQAFRQFKKAGIRNKPGSGIFSIMFERKRYNSSVTGTLFFRNDMIWMICQTGIIDSLYKRMIGKKCRDLQCIGAVLFDPEVEGFNSPDHQPAVKRGKDGTRCILNKPDLFPEFCVACHNNTCYEIAMSTQVFCCTVHYNVCTERNGLLQGGRSK